MRPLGEKWGKLAGSVSCCPTGSCAKGPTTPPCVPPMRAWESAPAAQGQRGGQAPRHGVACASATARLGPKNQQVAAVPAGWTGGRAGCSQSPCTRPLC